MRGLIVTQQDLERVKLNDRKDGPEVRFVSGAMVQVEQFQDQNTVHKLY